MMLTFLSNFFGRRCCYTQDLHFIESWRFFLWQVITALHFQPLEQFGKLAKTGLWFQSTISNTRESTKNVWSQPPKDSCSWGIVGVTAWLTSKRCITVLMIRIATKCSIKNVHQFFLLPLTSLNELLSNLWPVLSGDSSSLAMFIDGGTILKWLWVTTI